MQQPKRVSFFSAKVSSVGSVHTHTLLSRAILHCILFIKSLGKPDSSLVVLQSLSLKIEDELRKSKSESGRENESDLARRNAERRLFGSVGIQSDRIRQEMQRYASMRDPTMRYCN